ncbi:MAG: glycine--tRNA ligase subunit beta, partial [Oscillatoriales cyanobacterium SM2_1_8]|nr:glycine--tRNA ligase subunit beta [Oscillatoriales cyanobacterium SM2_1_8]
MATFLLEVGTEELPASFVADALRQWETKIPANLTALGLTATLHTYGTPRRLAVVLTDLPDRQPDRELAVKGPALAAAFGNGDPQGEPTKAAIGFAKAQGVTTADLVVRDTEKGPCVFALRQEVGRPTAEVLTELAPQWVLGLEGKRLMRWGHGDLKFPRPIRWLVGLLDDQVLPIALEGLKAGRQTWGHRVLAPGPVLLDRPADYLPRLREAGVLADVNERRERICQQMTGVAELMGATVEVLPDLLAEVVHLVEFPTAVVGEFDREFLKLPEPAIVMEMVVHQRYFPVYDRGTPRAFCPISSQFPTATRPSPNRLPRA